uniref:Uncharacterized protein n=1 Tax=Oryza rufipogon TaxID=4529 RepID=A0A0E0QTL6_ORYRU
MTPRLPPSHRQASERDTAEEREGETAVRGRRTWRRGDAGAGGVGAVQRRLVLALVRLADTPCIKRGLESPSAWKSPWFVDMQFQGSYFVSPADRTYNALGFVKQINVQTAAALAEAREVLVSGGQSENINSGKENLETTVMNSTLPSSKQPMSLKCSSSPATGMRVLLPRTAVSPSRSSAVSRSLACRWLGGSLEVVVVVVVRAPAPPTSLG